MSAFWVVALVVVLIVGPFATLRAVSRRRMPLPLPEHWAQRVFTLVPQTAWLAPSQHPRFLSAVETFLRDKRFIGCNGLVVDAEMRLSIAGLAALLVLRDDAAVFPSLRSVLLYPDAFLVRHTEPDENGLVNDHPVEQIGESWHGDRIILSWADVQAALAGDAVNVVAHELAHQLDDETPAFEGAPRLVDYTRWSEVMQREFERLQRHRRPPVLDPYGAESPAEFFGVVTEAFFQQPQALLQHHAELYALLRDYYRLDPAAHPPPWTQDAAQAAH